MKKLKMWEYFLRVRYCAKYVMFGHIILSEPLMELVV